MDNEAVILLILLASCVLIPTLLVYAMRFSAFVSGILFYRKMRKMDMKSAKKSEKEQELG